MFKSLFAKYVVKYFENILALCELFQKTCENF